MKGYNSRIVANEMLIDEVCNLLAMGKKVKLHAKGGSMFPFIRPTDTLVLAPVGGKPAKGDVVLAYTQEQQYVVHRITNIQADRVLLMGDANLVYKECCLLADVKGVVIEVLRAGKSISLQSRRHRMASRMWCRLLPLRRCLLFIIKGRN